MLSFFSSKGRSSLVLNEDQLSSLVFDLLKYLPTEIFYKILKESLYQDKLPKISGNILNFSFWEKWNPDNTTNIKFVEPDIFVRFDNFDIILEAKRYNENQQYKDQLVNQIQSYFNEFSVDNKELIYVQVGGLYSKTNEGNFGDKEIKICKTDWSKILNSIVKMKDNLEILNLDSSQSSIRILNDLIKGFSLFNFNKILWLESLESKNKINTNINLFTRNGK